MAETIYTMAARIIAQRRQDRRDELFRRKNEVFSKVPRIREIEAELDRFGMRMLNRIASGECDEESAVAGIMAENKQFMNERQMLLEQNGFSGDYLTLTPYCQLCDDTGFCENKVCSCLKNEITACALKEANLSESLAGQTFADFNINYYSDEYVEEYGCSPRENMRAILNECKAYAESFSSKSENLLFCGGCGLGKTFMSSAIANELLEKGVDVLYISCNSLFPILEDMHFGRDVSERAAFIVKKISECELLILDDLGSEFVTQFTSAELFRIINTRLISGRKMIISTNLNRNMLQKMYTERIASRIMGTFSVFEFLGTDIRGIKKLENRL